MSSTLDEALLEAYRATEYQVDAIPPLVLHVDRPSAGLAALYARFHLTSAAFITACNPHGQLTPEGENQARNARLRADLRERALPFLEGRGVDPLGTWPPEASLLVLGLSREEALALGERHEQNALLWADVDAIPRLLLLR